MIAPKGPSPSQQQKEEQKTSQVEEKRGIACLEVPIAARHGDPPTVVVVDALPYECFGQKMTPEDLVAFGAGAAEGLKETFDVTTPVSATYQLGLHEMWIQRARATPKGKAGPTATLETVCTLLEKAAVCWVARATDEISLHTFELVSVMLDGAHAPHLVPANVFITTQ